MIDREGGRVEEECKTCRIKLQSNHFISSWLVVYSHSFISFLDFVLSLPLHFLSTYCLGIVYSTFGSPLYLLYNSKLIREGNRKAKYVFGRLRFQFRAGIRLHVYRFYKSKKGTSMISHYLLLPRKRRKHTW